MTDIALDYRTAFDLAPIGLVLSRQRQIVDCNRQVLTMFGATLDQLVDRSAAELLALHGFGPRALRLVSEALDQVGLSLRT